MENYFYVVFILFQAFEVSFLKQFCKLLVFVKPVIAASSTLLVQNYNRKRK